ncbi:MAG TPA: lipid-A-disaccharide synthase [Candidatus Cloacimonetes bacterium]|nr:lipid-A-disaccharide synthase [Candidatus Cloacimonadota bacterium]
MKNIFMLVGERSADVHAAEVIKQLKQKNPSLNIWGIGGPLMQKQGFESIFPFSKFSIIGFAEVISHLGFILKVFRKIKSEFIARKPDLAILVDYPGMNIRVAKIAYEFDIPVLYYISPQVWAWKKKRIHKIAEYSNKIAVIFPFENELYEEIGADVEYVGHPISEEISISETQEEFAEQYSIDSKKDWVGFIPGSRNVEIKRILPEIVETIKNLKKIYNNSYQYLISQADSVSDELFQKIISPVKKDVTIIHDTHTLMKYSKVVVCKSGTSTLETGYLGTPMVVVYKTSSLSYFIARAFIKINMIALANIVIGEKVVPELIQHDASAENITKDVRLLLEDDNYYQKIKSELRIIKEKLGKFNTSEKVALIALSMINET